MRNLLLASVLALGAAALPGCLLVAGAAIGAGIVYASSDDTAEVRLRTTTAAAYAAAREEVLVRGTVESSDPKSGVLEGKIGSTSVRVTVVAESDGMVKVSVKARSNSGLSPDMDTANQVTVAVVKRIG